ncbi:hypothetical protein ACFL0H_15330, partial [Thermodesulfobacteriota bacterium]
ADRVYSLEHPELAWPRSETMRLADLDLSAEQVGEAGSPTRLVSMSRIKRERKCEFITGSAEEQADDVIRKLKESGLIG